MLEVYPARLCTVCERRTLPSALVLAESFQRWHGPAASCLVVVADEEGSPGGEPSHTCLLAGHELGIRDFDLLAATYPAPELARALIPFALRRMGPPCVYLAPDAEVLASIEVPEADVAVVARGADGPPLVDDGFVSLLRPADELLDWWQDRVRREGPNHPWLDAALGRSPVISLARDTPLSMAAWNIADRPPRASGEGPIVGDRPAAWLRFDGLDAIESSGVSLADQPVLRQLVDEHEERLKRHGAADVCPGYSKAVDGTPLDRRLRRLLGRAINDGVLSEGPFHPPGWAAAVTWLRDPDPDPRAGGVGRFLYDIYRERGDLQAAYPRLEEPEDRDGLLGWMLVHGAGQHEIPAPLVPDPPPALGLEHPGDHPRLPWGLNVAGYFKSEVGVGEAARRVIEALDAADVTALPVHGSSAPPSRRGADYGSVPAIGAPFAANLVCVNADGLPGFIRDVGSTFVDGRFSIGLWWWELLDFPTSYHGAFEHLDEIWVGSRHVLEAISAAAPVPVVRVPLPVSVPEVGDTSRETLGLPPGFVFLFVFDFNSVMRRKNPIGLIDAFSRAFGPGEGPQLVIKSINGDRHPDDRERLLAAASRHPDVHVIDRYVTAPERDAMIASCDAYVSLHRSEGFGLTIAEAMYLGRPVIATAYSGNLDFMDADSGWLIPHRLEEVGPGAEPYPVDAVWADPDLDVAAVAMREVATNSSEAAARGQRGAASVRRSHSPHVAGTAMARRLETLRPRIEDRVRSAGAPRTKPQPKGFRPRLGGLARRALERPPPSGRDDAPDADPELAVYAALLARMRRYDARLSAIERTLGDSAEEDGYVP